MYAVFFVKMRSVIGRRGLTKRVKWNHSWKKNMNNITWFQLASLDSQRSAYGIDSSHDDVIKWKHFPRYWLFMRGIHRWPVDSTHKGQWRGALMFSFIRAWINGWVNNREAGDLRHHPAHYDVIVMCARYASLLVQSMSLDDRSIMAHTNNNSYTARSF